MNGEGVVERVMCQCPGRALTGAEMKSRERVQMDLMMLSAQGYMNKALESSISLKRIILSTV